MVQIFNNRRVVRSVLMKGKTKYCPTALEYWFRTGYFNECFLYMNIVNILIDLNLQMSEMNECI